MANFGPNTMGLTYSPQYTSPTWDQPSTDTFSPGLENAGLGYTGGGSGPSYTAPTSWWDDFTGAFKGNGALGGFFGGKDANGNVTNGWGGTAIGAASGLMSGFMGMQQYGLAKQQFAQQKKEYEQNYAAQRQLTNSQLEDRQRARVASNPGAYESVGAYMDKNGVK